MKRKRGLTLIELLIAILISTMIIGAIGMIYTVSNRTFKTTSDKADVIETARNAMSTLEFIFSRWGVGVPCVSTGCILDQTSLPDCPDGYPPTDPMCVTVINETPTTSRVIFYASLYGIGLVNNTDASYAYIVGCRLSNSPTQNCYFIWKGNKPKGNYTTGWPPYFRLTLNGTADCVNDPTINTQAYKDLGGTILESGDYIIRVPHKITLYVNNGYLYMDRTDVATVCNDNENAVKIAKVESFKATKIGRSIRVDITFIGNSGSKLTLTRYFGR